MSNENIPTTTSLLGLAIYLGIGAMLHALFVGEHLDWTSAWTIGWLLCWPIMLVASSMTFLAVVVGVLALLGVASYWADEIGRWNLRRKLESSRRGREKRSET